MSVHPRYYKWRIRYMAAGISVLLTSWMMVWLYWPDMDGMDTSGRPIGQDFINIWAGPQIALHKGVSFLFNRPAYLVQIRKLFGANIALYNWSYPPQALLLYYPFSLFSYFQSYALWTAAGLGLFIWLYRKYAGYIDIRALVLLCLSPAAAMNMIDGQNGFLTAALLIGGFLAVKRYPVLAGILFGALTFKPQLGVLVPFVLIFLRAWKTIGSAAVTSLVLAGLGLALFGAHGWDVYFSHTSDYQLSFLTEEPTTISSYMMMSPLIAARLLGADSAIAFGIQAGCAMAALILAIMAVRRTPDTRQRIMIICTAVPLMSPYIFNYDLCLVTVPLVYRLLDPSQPGLTKRLIYFGAWLSPTMGMFLGYMIFRPLQAAGTIFLVLVFVLEVAHAFAGKASRKTEIADESPLRKAA